MLSGMLQVWQGTGKIAKQFIHIIQKIICLATVIIGIA